VSAVTTSRIDRALAKLRETQKSECCRTTMTARRYERHFARKASASRVSGQRGNAREAAKAGDFIVFGAPNVVRGGSHTGWTKAADMIAMGLCSILASDYYYPARCWRHFGLPPTVCCAYGAWDLISAAPPEPQVSPIAVFSRRTSRRHHPRR